MITSTMLSRLLVFEFPDSKVSTLFSKSIKTFHHFTYYNFNQNVFQKYFFPRVNYDKKWKQYFKTILIT